MDILRRTQIDPQTAEEKIVAIIGRDTYNDLLEVITCPFFIHSRVSLTQFAATTSGG